MKQTIIAILFSTFCFSCDTESILNEENKNLHSNERTNATVLTVTSPITITSNASYDTLVIKNGGEVSVASGVTFNATWVKNQVNHIYVAKITANSGSNVTLSYTMSMGNMKIYNYGYMNIGQLYSSFSGAEFKNYGTVDLTGLEMVFYAGKFYNSGLLTSNQPWTGNSSWSALKLQGGTYESALCGRALLTTFTNNTLNGVSGTGRIMVTIGSAYLYQNLTTSSNIRFCANSGYGGTSSSNTGSATIDCEQVGCSL